MRAAEPATGNGIPDTSFLVGVRNNNLSEGGLFTAVCPTAAAPGETAAQFNARRAAACSGIANPSSATANAQFGRTFVFLPDGPLTPNPCVTAAYDPTTAASLTFLNSILDFDPPKLKVKEVFGKVSVPIVNDVPFIRELTLWGAARYSDYNIGQTGGVRADNANLVYSPISDVRFRASYARAVRAPSQSDLFSAASQTFINGFTDPCSQTRIDDNPNRKANCAAAGVPTTQAFTVGGVPPPSGSPTTPLRAVRLTTAGTRTCRKSAARAGPWG